MAAVPPKEDARVDDEIEPSIAKGSEVDDFFALVFALSTGAFSLLLVLLQFVAKGVGEHEEQKAYVLVWPLALIFAVVVPTGLRIAQRRWLPSSRLFWPLLGLTHTALWTVAVSRLELIDAEKGAKRAGDLVRAFRWILIVQPALTLCLFGGLFVARALLSKRRVPLLGHSYVDRLGRASSILLTTAGLAWLAIQFSQTIYPRATLFCLLIVGAFLTFTTRTALTSRSWSSVARNHLLVLGVLILLLWCPETPEGTHHNSISDFADVWVSHYNFFLGPVAGILQGRSPLVDVNSQYGVGIVYFVALTFRLGLFEWSTHGLAHLICALEIARFFLLYVVMRRLTRSSSFALLFLCAALAINVYAPKYIFFRLPNEGPLRFVAEYALVVAIAFQPRREMGRRALLFRAGILGIVTLGALWSLDMAVATVGAYLGTRALVHMLSALPVKTRVAGFASDVALTCAAVGLGLGLLALYVRATAGAWPIWSRAYEYVVFYSTWAPWSYLIEDWAMWLPTGLVYLGSVISILRRRDASVEAQTVLAMSLVGIAEMNYYVGRSLIENLAAVSIPAVFVGTYWLAHALQATRGVVRFAAGTAGYAAGALLIFTGVPGFSTKIPFSLLVHEADAKAEPQYTRSAEAHDAAALMAKYAPTQRRVAVFLSNDAEVEALLLARKTQLWPLGYHEEDGLLPRALKDALEFDAPLRVGDVVFVGPSLTTPAREINESLNRKFEFTEIDTTSSGVRALRVLRGRP